MRLTPDQRRLIGPAVDRIGNKSLVAEVFGITRKIVRKWCNRRKHLKDRKRKKKKPKVSFEIELFILALRNFFEWGTERIRKGLYSLPKFMLKKLRKLKVRIVQKVSLSRQTINDVLKKHKLNGYKHKSEGWKFFRAKKPNKLWQLDIKGPFNLRGKKYYFVICIDDYSRYMLLAEQLEHEPTIEEIAKMLRPLVNKYHPESILTDNNPFKVEWDSWCRDKGIEPLHAHPYYPQDKGKVERTIRNVTEGFVNLLIKFPEWLNGEISEYQDWFNNERYHCGIKAIPCQLYT